MKDDEMTYEEFHETDFYKECVKEESQELIENLMTLSPSMRRDMLIEIRKSVESNDGVDKVTLDMLEYIEKRILDLDN